MSLDQASTAGTQNSNAAAATVSMIAGGGELSSLVRTRDWSSTPLGSLDTWSETLVATANLLLLSPFAFTVFWGAEHTLLYNDAYRRFLGSKHPASLGISARRVWNEVWPAVGAAIEGAFQEGVTTTLKNALIPIEIDGVLQNRYWNCCFYPVYEQGHIVGVAEIVFDSTEEVLAARSLQKSREEASRVLQSIGDGVIVTDAETTVVRMNPVAEALTGWPLDEAKGRPLSEVFHIVNESTRQVVESPADKALRLGTVVGLANHTILIDKHGAETSIDDSGAPIRDDEGKLTGIVLVFRDITGRRSAERERDANARHLQEVLDVSADGVAKLDRDWRITFLNAEAKKMLAGSGNVLGRNHWEAFPSAVFDGSPWLKHYYAAMNDKVFGEFDHYYPAPLDLWMHITVRPIEDGIVVYFRDTTEEHQAAKALRAGEERLRLALAAANGVGIWDWDVPNDRVYADAGFAAMYGVEPGEAAAGISVRQFRQNMHPEDSQRVEVEIAEALRTGADFASEYRLLQRDGTVRWVYAVGRCSFRDDGRPLRFPGVTVDITERKATEEALRESQMRFNAIYSNSHEYIGILHTDGAIVDFNRAALAFAGNTPHEIKGVSFPEGPWFRHTPGAPELVQHAVRRAAAGEIVRTELPLIRPTGETLVFDFSLSPVRGETGEVIFLVPEARDITEVKLVDEALRASEARLRVAAETAHLGIWQLDLSTYRLECSDLCKINYGRSPDDPFSYEQVLSSVYHEDLAGMQKDLHDAIESRLPFRSEYRILWPDESLHWILASGRVLSDDEGEPIHMVGVSLDVTDRRLAEAALLQSEKLAAVGRLAASIAHEINNPLESVTNLLYLARGDDNLAVIQQYLDMAERELRRVSVISNQTLRFHKQSTRPKAVTFEDLIESVLSIHQGRIVNSRVEVGQRRRATQPISCFDGEIRQVLNNLVGNAVDAMHPNGGRLLIRSRQSTAWSTGGQGLMITIADTGTGMSAATQKKIFNPFFTTKGLSGNGLGLWVSKEIVERHHGMLRTRSSQRAGRSGTVFTFFLPFEAAVR